MDPLSRFSGKTFVGAAPPFSVRSNVARFAPLTGPGPQTYNLPRAQNGHRGNPPQLWGCSSAGRALASHVRGQEFESPHLHQVQTRIVIDVAGFLFARFAERLGVIYDSATSVRRKLCEETIRRLSDPLGGMIEEMSVPLEHHSGVRVRGYRRSQADLRRPL